ncbi:MAG: hypothetical protein DMF98_17175 [Acidobacteria bacterium]|nr:MAG: hypothetical protein DMF98_17175 [Acidobacteriota bacterium]
MHRRPNAAGLSPRAVKPLPRPTRLSVWKAGEGTMRDWSFSDTAEWVVGLLLAVVIVATILVFTDGDDTASKTGLGTVIDRARTEEVMIYAIGLESHYMGPNGRMIRTRPDRGLRKFSDETGGGYFELEKSADLAPTFTKVAQELHSQYVLGFTPAQLDGRMHKLAVKMKQTGLTARARRSYLAAADKTTAGDRLEK